MTADISPHARHILARLLDSATFVPLDGRPDLGDVVTDDKLTRVAGMPRAAWVELIALTGKPDDVYAESGERIGRVTGWIGGVPVVRND